MLINVMLIKNQECNTIFITHYNARFGSFDYLNKINCTHKTWNEINITVGLVGAELVTLLLFQEYLFMTTVH